MVSSRLPSLTGTTTCKPFQNHLFDHAESHTTALLGHEDFDFSDVFGQGPAELSEEVDSANSRDSLQPEDFSEAVFADPVIIHSRSHSLVGPTICISKTLQLSKLTSHDIESSLELVKRVACREAPTRKKESSAVDAYDDSLQLIKSLAVGLNDFEVMKIVGRGAFGKVFQVKKKGTSDIYAMKVMRKDKITEKNHAEYMKTERDILTKIDHPFIVQLRYSFQTKYRLYLVLDFINGGHLFFQLYRHGLFREDLARIYTAEIVSAVSHLHANGIMHRDLKPENILLDADGHAMLTDFGLAKQFDENTRSNSMCGTVEYMAPEIVLGRGHDKAADWWSIGILLFEMLTGKPPFTGRNHEKIQQKILKDKIKLPAFLSSEAHSLLKGLLQKEASKRLDSEEIKRHKWFKSINWKKLEDREIEPSFRPKVAGKHCIANFEERWTSMPLLDSPAASPRSGDTNFVGFSFVKMGIQGAEECGNFEEWFNYRISRAAPETCAEFLGSFVADKTSSEFIKGGKWLVWRFEGDRDLADYMKDRSFPLNLESIMFGRVLQGLESIQRDALIIKQIMRQIITSLKKIHDTGIVHRDVKPANLVVTSKGKIKLIDFGAATDLRIGKNFVPNRGLLDPDYCPPELYVLPEETPRPPPEPIAAILSPILWQLNSPDLFDMYSVGITLLQMAIPSLRSSAGLKNFNTELKRFGYDLRKWRDNTRTKPDLRILDLESGRGWDLATKLISERGILGQGRLSAAAALRHPYFLLGGDQAVAVLSKLTLIGR